MKPLYLFALLLVWQHTGAQPSPFGTVYGHKPSHSGLVTAANLENTMGKRTRINVTISGRITQVTKAKGGWFDVDAGQGRIITAHFKNTGINLPANLKNRYILIEGVAEKQFLSDDHQHYAGHESRAAKQAPKQVLIFEVTGLEVRK